MLKIFHLTIESHYHSNKIIIGSKAKCALNNLPTMSNRPFKLPQVGNFLQQALIHQHFPESKERIICTSFCSSRFPNSKDRGTWPASAEL